MSTQIISDSDPHVKRDNARNLQTPGAELWRHDLAVHYFSKHPCELEVFHAQIDACTSEEEEQDVIYQWWSDCVPAYVRYSNRGPAETPRSRYEANHIRIAQRAAQLRGQAL